MAILDDNFAVMHPLLHRFSGTVLLVGAILSVAFMTLHPETTASTSAQAITEIVRETDVSRLVHGGLILVIVLNMYAVSVFVCKTLRRNFFSRLGMVFYEVGTFSLIGAAIISGFVISILADRYSKLEQSAQVSFVDLAYLANAGNQALAKTGVIFLSAAILIWSLSLLTKSGLEWGAGVLGTLTGSIIVVAIVLGFPLDVRGMTLVALGHAVFHMAIGICLLKGRVDTEAENPNNS